jgi:hypothetical protein
LGQGKWDLWHHGDISLSDLVDQSNHPLTLKQLQAST